MNAWLWGDYRPTGPRSGPQRPTEPFRGPTGPRSGPQRPTEPFRGPTAFLGLNCSLWADRGGDLRLVEEYIPNFTYRGLSAGSDPLAPCGSGWRSVRFEPTAAQLGRAGGCDSGRSRRPASRTTAAGDFHRLPECAWTFAPARSGYGISRRCRPRFDGCKTESGAAWSDVEVRSKKTTPRRFIADSRRLVEWAVPFF